MFKLASGLGRLNSLPNNQTGTGMQTDIKVVCLLLYQTVNFKLKKKKNANPVINYINKATINFKNFAKMSNPTQNLSNSLTSPQADVDDNDMVKYNI